MECVEDEVIDLLFALNVKRAEEEGAAAKPAKAKGGRKKGEDDQGTLEIM